MKKLLNVFAGDPNQKVLDQLSREAERINALEPEYQAMSDEELRAAADALKNRLSQGEEVEDITHEAFALVREAAKRTIGQRHYDVQLIGGLVMLRDGIAEMRTGEGKTLTATLPLFTRALEGKGAHLVTVNDYLARRDAVWMGQLFHALGLSVACVQHNMTSYAYDPDYILQEGSDVEEGHDAARDTVGAFKVDMDYLRPCDRREAYAADVTYGTNNEFGFDYLRDNMAPTMDRIVQGDLHFAIVDEVDSILIDEARTPLIISAPADEANEMYARFSRIMQTLAPEEDYNVDEKMRAATLTEAGIEKIERALGIENLYAAGVNLQHYADNALRAKALFERDVNYVVRDGEVVIVDEFTGRLMPGRRFSEGQHQAIEAKEGVPIQRESLTLATITFQNLFRQYNHLAGMTGTAATEAEEFGKIYNLDVTQVPTNKPIRREDLPDRVFKSQQGKYQAVVREIKERHENGQPVLVGTASIEKNELLGTLLERAGVPFNLLNAKNHEREAEIIAQAGRRGSVTIATNMAGRGVDIMLGGNPPDAAEAEAVKELGGLLVLGTERHESRRIDNQLRGRAGRQGDPGQTQFYLSMEDDLMRIFGSDRTRGIMDKLGIPEDVPIENNMVSRSIEKAQQRVESHHFDSRKHVLEYDDVLNKHREVIYARRREVLEAYASEDKNLLKERILDLVEGEVEQVVLFHTGAAVETVDLPAHMKQDGAADSSGDWDPKEIMEVVSTITPLTDAQKERLGALTMEAGKDKMHVAEQRTKLIEEIMEIIREAYEIAEEAVGGREQMRHLERAVILRAIDNLWVDHLAAMTALRTGIGLRGYGQRDPLIEYKKEAYHMFQQLLAAVNQEIVYMFFKNAHHASEHVIQQAKQAKSLLQRAGVQMSGAVKKAAENVAQQAQAASKPTNEAGEKIGRNDPCHCGSGKKYKRCHGK